MDYAYFVENTDNENYRDNSGVFLLVQDLGISQERVYIDTGQSRVERDKLIKSIRTGDRIIIRSVKELSEESKGLLEILDILQNTGIILCSCSEPFLNGTEYHTSLQGFVNIYKYYLEKKRKEKYESAKKQGTVGRPKQTEAIEKAIRLYNTKAFTIEEVEKLSGISSSTLYRYLKGKDKQ